MATVQEILQRKGASVVSMIGAESVLNAARLMNERGIGGIVVTENGKVVGIFTERDILRRVVAEQRDPAATPIHDVMSAPVMTVRPDATLEQCVALITARRIRHIPVTDGDDGLCGIITSGDILAFQVKEQQDIIEFLNSYVYNVR